MLVTVRRLVLGRPRLPPPLPRLGASIFYLAIASLIVPSILISLGIGLLFRVLGLRARLVQLGASARTSPGRCRSAC